MTKPSCKLIGTDGNIFALIGKSARALEKAGMRKEAAELKQKLFSCESYNEALQLIMQYVDVE